MAYLMVRLDVVPALLLTKAVALLATFAGAWWLYSDGKQWYAVAALGVLGIIHLPVVIINWKRTR
jgi:hypothetical protein